MTGDEELRELMSVGNKVRWRDFYDKGDLLHILAVVDEDQIVYKHWYSPRQLWIYNIKSITYFSYFYEADLLEKVK